MCFSTYIEEVLPVWNLLGRNISVWQILREEPAATDFVHDPLRSHLFKVRNVDDSDFRVPENL